MSNNVHWIGAGLASAPGIIALAEELGSITLWDLTIDRAIELQGEVKSGQIVPAELNLVNEESVEAFMSRVSSGDVIVSMLPAHLHLKVAEIALSTDANLVTSSYISDEMRAFDAAAKKAGVSFVNEVGLDPGIDHLFAHIAVEKARSCGLLGKGNKVDFVSYCGGVPEVENDFKYKFSWTPLGVLTALKNASEYIDGGKLQVANCAWEAHTNLDIKDEIFEVYPNRNSLPYVEEYGLEKETALNQFVRGTLRLSGWKNAWKDVFSEIESADQSALAELSQKLWDTYKYADDEKDRVVLYVGLNITSEDGQEWSTSLALDEVGSGIHTAMARTVSLTVAEAVKAVLNDGFEAGVHAAVTDAKAAEKWLLGLEVQGLTIHRT